MKRKKFFFIVTCLLLVLIFTYYHFFKTKFNEEEQIKLKESISNNDIKYVTECIKNGLNVNDQQKIGFLPLLVAINTENIEMVNFLLKNGVDVNEKEKNGLTPGVTALMFARKLYLVNLLIEHGANINIADDSGFTALHWYAGVGRFSDGVKLLVNKGADFNYNSKQGLSPLSVSVISNNYEIIILLINYGSNVNILDKNNCNLLHINAQFGQKDERITQYLIDRGLSVDQKDVTSKTPLMKAILYGYNANDTINDKKSSIIRCLIRNGANLNTQDNNGYTALHWAVEINATERVKILLKSGAKKNIQNNKGELPIDIAKKNYNTEIIKLLE